MLSLFGPDNSQKFWNYYEAFKVFMKRNGRKVILFHMKDARFGLLSRCAAIVCYHFDDFCEFLSTHEYVTNNLACLVRDALDMEYIKL